MFFYIFSQIKFTMISTQTNSLSTKGRSVYENMRAQVRTNFYRFLHTIFPLGHFDTSFWKIWPYFFPNISCYHLGNKAHGTRCSPMQKMQMIHLHSEWHSTQFPRLTRRLPHAACRGTVPMAKEERRLLCRDFRPGIRLGFAETLIESSRRRVGDVHFIIIAPNESHFPASRRS